MKTQRTILLSTLTTAMLLSSIAQAGYKPVSRNVCALSVHPFNPTAVGSDILSDTASSWFNIYKEGTTQCDDHAIYPNAYTPQPPSKTDAPLKVKTDIEDKSAPETIHKHIYYNDSSQDNYYYKSFTDSFQIILESDTRITTNLDQIVCYTPGEGGTVRTTPGCSGTLSDWGGTEITIDKSSGVINWKFATGGTGRPRLYGINPGLHGRPDVPDTNNEDYRKLEFGVKLVSNNNSGEIWSATTTSRTLVRDQALLKTSSNLTPGSNPDNITACTGDGTAASTYDYDKWCTLPDSSIGASTKIEQKGVSTYSVNGKTYNLGKNYYWKQIGVVSTVWQKPTPAPTELACADLQWDGPFLKKNSLGVFSPASTNPNALLANQEAVMKTKVIYESGSGTKRPVEYVWTSFKGDQNRPTWFSYEDTLYNIDLTPFLTTSLPYKLIKAAHAAPYSSANFDNTPNFGIGGPIDKNKTDNAPSASASLDNNPGFGIDGSIDKNISDKELINLGKFKDELASAISYNPLTDVDVNPLSQAYYSGGSDGVTVGVQAFYTDGKNVPGQGPMVNTPTGNKQKAVKCHLELQIMPPPAVCIDLDISPKDIKPNTPVTFTVTPKFNPASANIPLNYYWNAQKYAGGLGPISPSGFDPSQIGPIDPSAIPGASIPGLGSESSSKPSWWSDVLTQGIDTGAYLGNLGKIKCPGPGCPMTEPGFNFDPLGPVSAGAAVEGQVNSGLGSGLNDSKLGVDKLGVSQFGTNIFSADGTKIAALPSGLDASIPAVIEYDPSALAPSKVIETLGGVTSNDQIDKDGATMDEILYGGFKDYQGGPLFPTNPYLETTDNKTYYSGGPAGTLIKVQAQGKDGTVYPLCKDSLVIPALPSTKCQILKVKFMDGATEVSKDALQPGKPYTIVVDKANSKKEDGTLITKYDIRLNNADGPGTYGTLAQAPGNAASCSDITGAAGTIGTDSTSVDCKYTYTPKTKDHLKVEADPTDGVALCTVELTIPEIPVVPICKALNLTTNPLVPGHEFGLNQLIKLSASPKDTNNAAREPLVYTDEGPGYFVADPANAASCTAVPAEVGSGDVTFEAPSSCKYSYKSPNAIPSTGKAHFSVRVKQDDGVSACNESFELKVKPEEKEMCLALNFRVNGAYTLSPAVTPGTSYSLSANPQTNKGNPITLVEWSENGPGKLVGDVTNPAICPAVIDNGNVTTPSFCRYIFSSPAGSTGIGFSAHAIPDNGNANCMAKAQGFQPPVVTPYCLYLDLDTSGTFNPLASNNMNATVVMSDGSKYNNNVRFVSSDGFGQFSGGYTAVMNNNTSNFRTNTDATNNTHNVNFSNGKATTGINVMLADTSITQTAACQRSLSPTPQSEKCTTPPNITKKSDTQYCAEGGDSKSYCWTITGGTGGSNPLFSNGTKSATGNCVSLKAPSEDFKLQVEDCNPAYANICYDNYKETPDLSPPKLEKRISKDMVSFGRQVNYSTKGSVTVPVYYKLSFYPYNYESGKNMTVTIHDPAFTGTIYSHTTGADGKASSKVGTIKTDLNSIVVKQGSNTYNKCSSGYNPLSDCFEIVSGALVIHGIQNDEVIQITYKGSLTSAITAADCQEGKVCNEQFVNQSYATEMKYCHEETNPGTGEKIYPCDNIPSESGYTCSPVTYYDSTGKLVTYNPCSSGSMTVTSEKTIAELVCQYFLTRASGDIFLEDQLRYGIDVSKCYPFKNISSTITKPIPERPGHLIKTGTEAGETVTINHEICSAGQTAFNDLAGLTAAQKKALSELYGADLTTLSSQICEVGLVPGVQWTKEQISKAIEQNVGKLTRWDDSSPKPATLSSVTDIINNGRVYYFNGETSGSKLSISGLDMHDNDGPLTIIVENADLYVDGDIKYTPPEGVDLNEPITTANLASLGVIVLNGNMYVGNNVKQLDGAYFVQRNDNTDLSKGNVLANPNEDTDNLLTVSGSIFGNIGPIFAHRVGAGDIAQDQGAITIRYDQRIIQNPPAGLAEILGDLSSGQIAQ